MLFYPKLALYQEGPFRGSCEGIPAIQTEDWLRHIGLYPGPEAVAAFAERLTDYKTRKGTIQLLYSKPLPLELIGEIAAWCEANSQK